MLTRRELVILAVAGAPVALARSAAAQAPELPAGAEAAFDSDATAEDLVLAMFVVKSGTGSATGTVGTTAEQDAEARRIVSPFLDPAYQMQRASGERYVAETYVPVDVDSFEIVGVRGSRPSKNLVAARYAARTPGSTTTDTNMVMSGDLAPRLTVFRWDETAGHWKVLSHANFNTPVSAICDEAPLEPAIRPAVATSAEDIALARSLIQQLSELAMQGDTRPMLDPQVQSQSGGGQGYTTLAEWMPTKYLKFELSDLLVTRNDDVLVASYRGLQEGRIHGVEVKTEWEPRLMTWRLDESGEWKLVAAMIFAEPRALPPGRACTPSG